MKIKTKQGIIDFFLKTEKEVTKIKDNTYKHCNFRKLNIVGGYTSVTYKTEPWNMLHGREGRMETDRMLEKDIMKELGRLE